VQDAVAAANILAEPLREGALTVDHLRRVQARREWPTRVIQRIQIAAQNRIIGPVLASTSRPKPPAAVKLLTSIFVANLIEYAKEGFKPDRDIILALTADEELSDSPHDGAHYLVEHYRDLIDAEFAINEGGRGPLRDGKPFLIGVQLAEKVYQTYVLEVTDRGGHSASGRRDNAIYVMADALRRLGQFDFPVALNPVTRAFFERTATVETGPMAEAINAMLAGRSDAVTIAPLTNRPDYNAVIRTTCVPTQMEAGHAENALPQTVRTTVNCRILPDQPVEEVARTLARVIADDHVKINLKGLAVLSPPSPINPEVMRTIETLSNEMWPSVPVIPIMSGAYTDNRWLRNAGIPSYGVSGLFVDPVTNGVHGLNEQVGVKELYDSKEYLYRLIKRLAAPSQFSQR